MRNLEIDANRVILCELCGSLRLCGNHSFESVEFGVLVRAKTPGSAKLANKNRKARKHDLGRRSNDLLAIDAQIVVTQIFVRI